MESLIILIFAAGLGLIPAKIASDKGHSFGLWWFYGFMLFIIAIVHVQFIEDLNAPKKSIPLVEPQVGATVASVPDEIRKYKELLDQGVISQAEFEEKKKKLLSM